MKKTLIQLLVFIFIATMAMGQAKDEDVLKYIQKYKDIAIAEQIKYNIPASIKLAQGILESSGGKSELALQAGNHFGIKCKSSWTGDTYYYDDDARQECFRKYERAEESFLDHSQFLIANKRYASLFDIHPVNYKDWAYQLKNCGYATSPKYAENLIRVIETYALQDITLTALNQKEIKPNELIIPQHTGHENVSREVASGYSVSEPETMNSKNMSSSQPVQTKYQEPVQQKYYTVTTLHGIKGFYAKKGDMLLNEAIRHKIRYPLLLKINDLKDEPLPYDMFIYLDTKKKTGDRPHIIVKNNDNLHSISQQEGIQLAFLRELNQLEGNEEPETGEIVYLQTRTSKKPRLRGPRTLENVDISFNPGQNEPDFIAINQEPDPEEEPEDDGVVKEEESYDEAMSEEQLIAGEDEPDQDEEEVMVIIEKPQDENQIVKKQQEFRVIENEDHQPAEQKNSLEDLKRKMDRSVYSDADVTPISEDQKRKDLFSSNSKKEPQKENVIPKNSNELNRPPKQNLSYNDKVSREHQDSGNPNSKLVGHMKLVQTGMFPNYIPKSSGVEHTSAPVSAPKKVTPKKSTKKVAPKKTTTKKNTKTTAKKKTTPKNTKKTNVSTKKKTAPRIAPGKKTTKKKK